MIAQSIGLFVLIIILSYVLAFKDDFDSKVLITVVSTIFIVLFARNFGFILNLIISIISGNK